MKRTEIPDAPSPEAHALSVGQILSIMGLFGLAMIIAVTGYFAWSERRSLEALAQRDRRNTAFFLVDHASRLFEVATIALNVSASTIEGKSWDEVEHAVDIQRQMKLTADALPQIEDVWLNDADGRLRLTSFAYPTPATNAGDRDSFKQARSGTKDLIVGDLIVGRITKGATFLLAKGLQKPDGSFNGMVSATADIAYFSDYWSRAKLPEGSAISLVRAGSLDILTQFPPPSDPLAKPRTPPLLTSFMARGPAASPSTFDTPTGTLVQIGSLPLYLVIETPPDAVLNAWYIWLKTVLPFAGATFIALAGLTVAGFVQSRRDTEAHRELQDAQRKLLDANASLETTVKERTGELTESNEEIQRFAYIVSHDLRAPLVNIMGFTSELERLREDLVGTLMPTEEEPPRPSPNASPKELVGDFDEALGFIKSSITKMDRLINAILALSRQGGRRFVIERLDMGQLIRGITDATAHQVQEANATISIGDLPAIDSDRLAIEQVFSNLIDNALKYRRKDADHQIEVKGKVSGSFILYEVKDNGRGISAEDHKRIFELFRRSGVQDRQGEGIGLAHVKALIRSLGGIITVDSTLGEGSIFRVALPARVRN